MTAKEAVNWIINIMADIGKAEHCDLWHYEQALSEIKEMLESQPEQKKGEWIKVMEGNAYRDKCNQCGRLYPNAYGYNFCPNCGADMREGGQDGNK